MNRLIGILFIFISIAISIHVFKQLSELFDANGLEDSSMRWYNKLAWELIKGILAVVLLRRGIIRFKK